MTSSDQRRAAADLTVASVVKRVGAVPAVDRVSFDVAHGETLALLGPSGSGKTTLLAMIGGQLAADDGNIAIGGQTIAGLPPNRIDAATVFQDYALFPHMSVAENVAFGLQMRGVGRAEIRERVTRMLALVRLEGYAGRKVTQLSGGQCQRVATARALVVEPRVVLMDEPLGALDRQIRRHLQSELKELLHKLEATTVVVTHDQEEAFAMADRVAVMRAGCIEQLDTPLALYETPATEFVATFLGEGSVVTARVDAVEPGGIVVSLGGTKVVCRGQAKPGDTVRVLVRPEHVRILGRHDGPVDYGTKLTVDAVFRTGGITHYRLSAGELSLSSIEFGMGPVDVGQTVAVRFVDQGPFVIPGSAASSTDPSMVEGV